MTLPARRYELAGRWLTRATSEGGAAATAALDEAAQAWGREIGVETRARVGAKAEPARLLRGALDALRDAGFEPRQEPNGDVVLRNCPFAALQRETPALICGMNLALCRGLVAGLEAERWTPRLDPQAGRCCVIIETG